MTPRTHNKVNKVNKLVTIFAGNLGSFIMTNNQPKHLISTATSGSGQINVQMTLIPFAGPDSYRDDKNCAIPGLHRDSFPGPNGTSRPDSYRELSGPRPDAACLSAGRRQVTFTKLYCRDVRQTL
jgi:hypothetical protein